MLPSQYITSGFTFRFRRVTNATDNNYDGCFVDNIRIVHPDVFSQDAVAYEYKDGTSMATPHVVGLASMLRSANSGLSYAQVKNIIMQS
jgi:subtilisin family serine protease